MAIVKHLASKGGNYSDPLDYVMYKHDEHSREIIRDGKGNPVMRDCFFLDGINCEPYLFPTECRETNNFFHKNQSQNEILYHHFIVSFDPKDASDYDLTPERAHVIAKEWAEKCMPGFQILACTHTDGHNESGNFHTHLYVNSVRKYDTEATAYGERPIDHMAGYKLHLTNGYLEHMKGELMALCQRENLHQVDLLAKAPHRVTDREYYAAKRGQEKMDRLNREMQADGVEPIKTKYQTKLEEIRTAIDSVIGEVHTFEQFQSRMQQDYGVLVKESRGRWSYLPIGRNQYITERTLGTDYGKESLEKRYGDKDFMPEQTRKNETRIIQTSLSYRIENDDDCRIVFRMESKVGLVVKLQDCAKAQESYAYANKVVITNLQKMAETILLIQANNISSVEELDRRCQQVESRLESTLDTYTKVQGELKRMNEHIHYVGQYYANKDRGKNTREQGGVSKSSEIKYREALDHIEKHFKGEPPNLSQLKTHRDRIVERRNGLKKTIESLNKQKSCINDVRYNVLNMLDADREIRRAPKESHKQNRSNSYQKVL